MPCLSWYDDPRDTELLDMIPILQALGRVGLWLIVASRCDALCAENSGVESSVVRRSSWDHQTGETQDAWVGSEPGYSQSDRRDNQDQ